MKPSNIHDDHHFVKFCKHTQLIRENGIIIGVHPEAFELRKPTVTHPDPEKTLKGDHSKKGVLQALRDDFIDRQLAALTRRLIQPGITDSEMIEVEREKAKLRQQKGQPV